MTITKKMYRPGRTLHPFDAWFNTMMTPASNTYRPRYNEPAANVVEKENAFEVALAVPGMTKEDFNIKLDEQILTISAAKDHNMPEDTKLVSREFTYGHFSKSFILPETIKVADIVASYADGILTITLPKAEGTASTLREIKVN